MNYIVVSVICIVALIIGILNLFENELFSTHRKCQFIVLAIIIIIEIVLDTVLLALDGKFIGHILIYKILKVLEFIIAPFIPMILAKLIAHELFWDKIRNYFISLVAINATAQLVTVFEPLMFDINETDSTYSRTQFTYAYIIILLLCILLLVISASHPIVQSTARATLTQFSTSILIILGMAIRLFNNESNADWLCVTMCYFIFILYFANSYLKIDTVTTLLNRRTFNNQLSRIRYNTALIVIDANSFKEVNDTYGHQSGDLALLKISEAIRKTYGKIGYCYRIGGDEFCVILKKGMLRKLTYYTKQCDAIKSLEDTLDKKIKELSKIYPMLENGIAQGFDIYLSLLENPDNEDYKSIEEVLKNADEQMYKNKELKKGIKV